MENQIIEFIRKKDFVFVDELGQGGCGKTYLLYDNIIDENFVCKKYSPYNSTDKELLFQNFVQESKLLHLVYHTNVVRVYNYYLYPEQKAGYILMEYVKGVDIEEYLSSNPQEINEIFLQTIEGFRHLENNNILHRDIRPQNIMISENGIVKIIDFGFGKRAIADTDFDKSISLNWWCQLPDEFSKHIYDFKSEVYFVGKLFEKIITEYSIEEFKYNDILLRMCQFNHDDRISSFAEINKDIQSNLFTEIEFNYSELDDYRNFSNNLFSAVSKIESGAKYFDNIESMQNQLEDIYKKCKLEENIPTVSKVIQCFIKGSYYHNPKYNFPVNALREFIMLLRSCSKEKKNIILSNLQTKLDSKEHYQKPTTSDEDLPF